MILCLQYLKNKLWFTFQVLFIQNCFNSLLLFGIFIVSFMKYRKLKKMIETLHEEIKEVDRKMRKSSMASSASLRRSEASSFSDEIYNDLEENQG